jgi:hypothetical protein
MNELPPETRALLDLSRDADEPSAEDRRRVKRALAASLAGGALLAAPSAAAAPAATGVGAQVTSGVGLGAISTWLGVGLVTGLATSGAIAFVPAAPQKSPDPVAVRAPSGALVAPSAATTRMDEKTMPSEADTEVREAGSAEPTRLTPAPSSGGRGAGRPSAPTASIASETGLIVAAHAALGRGDARGALELLDQHEREFPEGALTEERLASKVFALCGLGRRGEAAQAAMMLLRRAPASPLRARVLDSCAYSR